MATSNEDAAPRKTVDFSKIKVGKSTLSGDVTTLVRDHDIKNRRARARIDRRTIEEAIEDHNIEQLRAISNHFYLKSGIYSRLCRYMAYLFKYDWFIIPHRYDEKVKDEKVFEGWVKSSVYLENCNLKRLFGEIALKVLRNGCYYGYILKESDAAYIQELPPNYCRTRYRVNGRYAVEFNIKYFDDSFSDQNLRLRVLKTFPREIQKAYVAYKAGNLPRDFSGDEQGWFLLDPNLSVKFNIGNSDAPLFVNIVPAILDLEDAKKLDKDKQAQQLVKLIVQELPLDKNNDPVFDDEDMNALHNMVVGMVGNAIGVDVLTTVADVKVEDLADSNNVTSEDALERRERTVYNEAGVSQQQFNSTGNLALEKSVANDEATMNDLVEQFREYAEFLLAPFNKNKKRLKYTVGILPTTIYNYKDVSKTYKEQTQIGFSKLLPQVALGHTQSDVISTALFENKIMNLNDLFVAPQMSSTMSGNKASSSSSGSSTQNPSSDTGGRPEKPDDEKSDKTIANKESES